MKESTTGFLEEKKQRSRFTKSTTFSEELVQWVEPKQALMQAVLVGKQEPSFWPDSRSEWNGDLKDSRASTEDDVFKSSLWRKIFEVNEGEREGSKIQTEKGKWKKDMDRSVLIKNWCFFQWDDLKPRHKRVTCVKVKAVKYYASLSNTISFCFIIVKASRIKLFFTV